MITAREALEFDKAKISAEDIRDLRNVVSKIDVHISAHMTFGGPMPLELPFNEMSRSAMQILCIAMKRSKWNVNATLVAEASRFQGGAPQPHHWLIQLQPTIEAYEEALSDFDLTPQQLLT
jgi:hypothetical protein